MPSSPLTLRQAPIQIAQLKGAPIPQDTRKVARTDSHTIQLASMVDGRAVPDFKVTLRTIVDKKGKTKIIDYPKIKSVKTLEKFLHKIESWTKANAEYLAPTKEALLATLDPQDRTHFAYLNIMGRRTEQFYSEMAALIDKSALSASDKTKARQAINLAHREAFRGREVRFDACDTGSYWGYTADHAFVHVFERMLLAMPESDPKRAFFQKQVDHILTHLYTPDGHVDECNIERTLSLVAIDPASRCRASMTKGSDQSAEVKYETLALPTTAGIPERAVYRDGKNYYFEATQALLTGEQVALLTAKPVAEIALRRPKASEPLREDFKFPWRGNSFVVKEDVSTGWWGFCDVKAIIQTLLADMRRSGGITEYRSDSGRIVEFDRAMQLEALAALINFGSAYKNAEGAQSEQGTYDMGGYRFNGTPDELILRTGETELRMPIRIQGLSKRGALGETDLGTLFATKIPDASLESFQDNRHIIRVEGGMNNYVNINDRKLTAVVEKSATFGYTYNELGQIVYRPEPFIIDPSAGKTGTVLIATKLLDQAERKIERYYYNHKDGSLQKSVVQFVEAEGRFLPKEGEITSLGAITGVEVGREKPKDDDVAGKMRMLEGAMKSGDKIACDSDPSEKVWNGDVYRADIKREWISHDKRWERVRVSLDATYGYGKVGTIINKLDAEGNVIDSCEVTPVVDFFWKARPRVASLLQDGESSLVNITMQERGLVATGASGLAMLSGLKDLSDLIYLGLEAKDARRVYTIVHKGVRLVYQYESEWREDVQRLHAQLG